MPINGFPGQVISATAPTVSTAGATGIWGLDEQLQYAGQNLWPGYQISRSVRLRSSASAYFSRTPSSATNRKTWTWSAWIKRGKLSAGQQIFQAGNTAGTLIGDYFSLFFLSSDILRFDMPTLAASTTNAVYRDPSSWYHIVIAMDTTQATAADRTKLYVNGVQQTFSAQSTITQNADLAVNNNVSHLMGCYDASTNLYDGYLTEINFIDGQALTPASFGVINAATGVWAPIKYTGTYGYNGFYLNFSDNSAATAAAIGKDYSGNGNNWTPNNISVTAGTTYDSMVDVPVQYGSDTGVGAEVRGNYCVMNPVAKNSRVTIANANLQLTGDNTSNHQITYGTFPMTTGKWYWEVVVNNPSTSTVNIVGIQSYIGFADGTIVSSSGNGIGWGYTTNAGNFYSSNFTVSGTAPVLANGTIGIAYDADAGKIWFRNTSGSWVQGDPAAGTSPTGTLSGTATAVMPAVSFYNSNGAWSFNFGQQAFSYTAPSGYKALCTANITAPAIPNGASYMAATLYTGNGAAGQSVVNTVNGVSFAPDFAWVKVRSTAGTDHYLADTVRGATKYLQSDTTAAEGTNNGITAFNSNGFSVGAVGDTNTNGATIVGWNWKAGGTAVSNTSGSITSSVSANPTAGFSIVTYTGTGANATVGHGLGVAPSMVIAKSRSAATTVWPTYHIGLTSASYSLELQSTAAQTNSYNAWNSTAPSSSVVSIGTPAGINTNGATYVMYCFAPIAGYSAFGSWQNNNSTSGAFTYLGFRPRFILLKNSDNTERWFIFDSARQTYNIPAPATSWLVPNDSAAEGANGATTATIDLLSNGFKIYTTNPASGEVSFGTRTYIYAAFAENPFKYALAR